VAIGAPILVRGAQGANHDVQYTSEKNSCPVPSHIPK
jgi:hypothetical protein